MTTEGTWVLRRTNDWNYVARAGGKTSYVRNLKQARRFRSRDEAEANRCPLNEVAVRIAVG